MGKTRKNHIPRVGDFNEVNNTDIVCLIVFSLQKSLFAQ